MLTQRHISICPCSNTFRNANIFHHVYNAQQNRGQNDTWKSLLTPNIYSLMDVLMASLLLIYVSANPSVEHIHNADEEEHDLHSNVPLKST